MHAPVSPEDAAWLADYENRTAANKAGDMGASASRSRKVSYTEEEQEAAAVGYGSAAEMAAGAAMVREEGRRIDNIVDRGINALVRAVETYDKMVAHLLKERQTDAALHRTLLESVRQHYIARTEAEAELIRNEADQAAGTDDAKALEHEALRLFIEKMGADAGQNGATYTPGHSGPRKKV